MPASLSSKPIVRRSLILVDGSNFYFKLRDLGLHQLLTFDFARFAAFLAGIDRVAGCTYHVGAVRTDGTSHTQALFDAQRRLLAHLRAQGWRYQLGYLLRSNGRFHEKGVDVHLALDMVVSAYEEVAERVLLVSSDTDLIPAIQKARAKGLRVDYIGFAHQPSRALMASCSASRLLKRADLLPFVKSPTPKGAAYKHRAMVTDS